MTVDEYNTTAGELLAAVSAETIDTGKISGLLNELREGFTEEASGKANAEKAVTDLTEKNKSLQESNMALFLKVGEKAKDKPEDKTDDKNGENYANDFSGIFDEKTGELL